MILNPSLSFSEVFKICNTFLVIYSFEFMMLYFFSIRYQREEKILLILKTALKVIVGSTHLVLVIIITTLTDYHNVMKSYFSPSFFYSLSKSSSETANIIFMFFFFVLFILSIIFIQGILKSKRLKIYLKASYIFLVLGLFIQMIKIGIPLEIMNDIPISFYIISEINRVFCVSLIIYHLWRGNDFIRVDS
jgi:hypothetical protein